MRTTWPGWRTWTTAWGWRGRPASRPATSSTRARWTSSWYWREGGAVPKRAERPAPKRRLGKPSERIGEILRRLKALYPDAHCELDHRNAYELLCATILSAQCTDARVNLVTPAFFARYPDARSLADADSADVEEIIRSTGFFRNKARSLIGLARA